jgi:hypothetical protein
MHIKLFIPHTCGMTPEDVLKWTKTCSMEGQTILVKSDGCNKIIYTFRLWSSGLLCLAVLWLYMNVLKEHCCLHLQDWTDLSSWVRTGNFVPNICITLIIFWKPLVRIAKAKRSVTMLSSVKIVLRLAVCQDSYHARQQWLQISIKWQNYYL